jgi:glycine/D-amino acid oxidase-like deaminating enzyme
MNPIAQAAGTFWKWLSAIPGALASRDHVDLLKTRVGIGEKELARAQEKNRELEEQVRKLHEELAAARSAEEFTHERGALFMRRPGGGYHDAVYCPRCRVSAMTRGPHSFYHCVSCQWISMIKGDELSFIIRDLTARDRPQR